MTQLDADALADLESDARGAEAMARKDDIERARADLARVRDHGPAAQLQAARAMLAALKTADDMLAEIASFVSNDQLKMIDEILRCNRSAIVAAESAGIGEG